MLSFPLPLGNFLKNALCQFIMTNQDVRGSSLVDAFKLLPGGNHNLMQNSFFISKCNQG